VFIARHVQVVLNLKSTDMNVKAMTIALLRKLCTVPEHRKELYDLGAHMELVNALRSPDEGVQLNTMGALRSLASAKEDSRNVVANAGDLLPTLQVCGGRFIFHVYIYWVHSGGALRALLLRALGLPLRTGFYGLSGFLYVSSLCRCSSKSDIRFEMGLPIFDRTSGFKSRPISDRTWATIPPLRDQK